MPIEVERRTIPDACLGRQGRDVTPEDMSSPHPVPARSSQLQFHVRARQEAGWRFNRGATRRQIEQQDIAAWPQPHEGGPLAAFTRATGKLTPLSVGPVFHRGCHRPVPKS